MQRVGYVGKTRNGRANGYGVYTFANGDIYEGSWENDNKSGFGKMSYHDGSFYEGQYFLDQRHGRGTYHYRNGDEYVGNWKNGRAHGPGIFRNASHGVVYRDVWNYGRSTKTGSPMLILLQSTWRKLAAADETRSKQVELEPGSPCWRSPSKKPNLVKAPRPKTAPVQRTTHRATANGSGGATMGGIGLTKTRFMEKVIMDSLGTTNDNWR